MALDTWQYLRPLSLIAPKVEFTPTPFQDLWILTPRVFADSRGYFLETFRQETLAAKNLPTQFVQDNQSMSHKGALRGLHFQAPPHAQDKLVWVTRGKVLDVVVDIRKHSPTYGKYFSAELSAENHKQLFVPKGFAHGFVTLEDHTIFQYKCTDYYNKDSEGGLLWNDTSLSIDWQITDPIISDKDQVQPKFDTFDTPFV